MSELKVYDKSGAAVRSIELPIADLGSRRGLEAVHEVVVAHRAALRGGNASTLQKGEVAGTNKKPWRQKGTGRARAGLRQSPVWRGGGIVFGPQPRDYSLKVNSQVRRLALTRAFSDRVGAAQVKVVEAVSVPDMKTRSFLSMVKAQGLSGPLLVIVESVGRELKLASRNLAKVAVVRASDVSAYELVRYPSVLMDVAALETIRKRLVTQ